MSIDWKKRQPKIGLGTQDEYDALNVLYHLCEDYTNLTGNGLFVYSIEQGATPESIPVCFLVDCNNTASLYRVDEPGPTQQPVCVECVRRYVYVRTQGL